MFLSAPRTILCGCWLRLTQTPLIPGAGRGVEDLALAAGGSVLVNGGTNWKDFTTFNRMNILGWWVCFHQFHIQLKFGSVCQIMRGFHDYGCGSNDCRGHQGSNFINVFCYVPAAPLVLLPLVPLLGLPHHYRMGLHGAGSHLAAWQWVTFVADESAHFRHVEEI